MFSNEYQGGTHVEVLGTQGQNPLSAWKVSGPQKGVQKVYDKALKGYVFACGAGCKMALPRDDRSSLGLSQPHLLLQLEIGLGGPFSVEVGVTDSSGTRRRMILSSSFSELKSTPLHCQVPLSSVPRDAWLNLVLPLADLAAAVFRPGGGGGGGGLGGSGPLYRSLDSLHLAGTCRLRRVCTLRDAPHLPQEGHDGQAMAPVKPLDFPPGLDCHTLLLDPRSMAFVSHTPANGGGGSGVGLGATGTGLGATGAGGGGSGGAGGGLGVVGTSTGATRTRPAALSLTHTSGGPGGGVVALGAVGTGRNTPAAHHGGPVAAALAGAAPAGAPGSSDDDDSGSGMAAASAGGLSGAPSGQLSGPLASLVEGSNLTGTLSGQSTPTGRHAPAAAPPSPWAISRGPATVGQAGAGAGHGHGHGEHPPPSRLGRSPGSLLSPNGAAAAAAAGGLSLLSLAPASGGRPPRGHTHGGASAGGAPSGGAGAADGHGGNTAEDPTGGDASPFGGRRAVSAQTAVRHGVSSTVPGGDSSTAPSGSGVVLGGAGVPGQGGAMAGASGAAAGGAGMPRSPPWPRSVMSKRAQSGPARISTEAMAQGLGETQAPDNMPMSPSLVPRHGRRAHNASNFPPTIVEHEALSMSGGGAPPGNGGPTTPGRGRGGAIANAHVPDRLPPLGAGRGASSTPAGGRSAGRGAAAGASGPGGHGGPSRARTTATNEVDVEESITLTAGMWGGFGVDEDDDMLGSRHFRSPGGHGGSDEERGGDMATGPSFGHGLAALGGADESGDGVSPGRGWGGGGGGGAAGAALPPMGASGPSPPGSAMGGARGVGGAGGGSVFGGAAGGALWPPRVPGLGGEELPASPTRYPAAAVGPLSPPIRRSGNRSGGSTEVPPPQHYQPTLTGHIAPLDNSPLQPSEGGREATFNGFAHFAPRRGSGNGGDGLDGVRASSPLAAPLPFDPLLDEEALLAGHHHAGGLLGAYGFGHLDPHDDPMAAAERMPDGATGADGGGGGGGTDWSRVGTGPTPPELLNPHRAFTPPVVPASKALGVALPPGGRTGGGRGGAGRGGRGGQVLKVAGGKEAAPPQPPASRPVIVPSVRESMVDLVYDPVLNCYYDGNTGQYYELKT
eukprot:XP_001691347.1 predicted protein [Chlamydomonas reinhardtii]